MWPMRSVQNLRHCRLGSRLGWLIVRIVGVPVVIVLGCLLVVGLASRRVLHAPNRKSMVHCRPRFRHHLGPTVNGAVCVES